MAFIFFGLSIGIAILYFTSKKLISTLRFQIFGELINSVQTEHRVVALTYDDGPHPEHTHQLIDVLDDLEIKATFFVVGQQLEQHPALARLLVERGHEVGNHSYSHQKMFFKSCKFLEAEIIQTDCLIRNLGVKGVIHFRSPFGYKRFRLPFVLLKMKKKNILWNIDTRDYTDRTAESVVRQVSQTVRPGSIVLFHDKPGRNSLTIEATKGVVNSLRAKGYQFRTTSELVLMQS